MKKIFKKLGRFGFGALARFESRFDKAFLLEEIPPSRVHEKWNRYVDEVSHTSGLRVLEVGSREVTGPSTERQKFANAEYVGFDYYPGRNVDVVGDAHRLTSYFKEGEQFDIIYSTACFEHFAMPWLVAQEISKLLKTGGMLFVATHFSFGAHERPWNFFQFSDMGLRVLFSSALGFECIEAGMCNPIVGRFSAFAHESVKLRPVRGLYSGSEFFGRKVRDVPAFDWNHVAVDDVVSGTTYPAPKPGAL